jgi:hypothetical protein
MGKGEIDDYYADDQQGGPGSYYDELGSQAEKIK